jgi:DNA-binding NtrC family response regulator
MKDVDIKTPKSKPRLTVLLAEDDDDTRLMLKHVLLFAGYEVIEVKDGMELMCFVSSVAVDERLPPDLIVSDIRMPIFSGLDMLRSVQRCAIDAPVVLISAFGDDSTRSLAEHFGAAALLQKPLSADDLLATLAKVLPERATGTSG